MNGFDPADPLISTDYSGWWQRSFRMVKAAWRPMAVVQLIVTLPALAAYLPAMVIVAEKQREALDGVESPGLSALFAGWQVFLPTAVAAVVLLLLGQLATQQVVVHLATGRP